MTALSDQNLVAEAREYLRMSGAVCWTAKNTSLLTRLADALAARAEGAAKPEQAVNAELVEALRPFAEGAMHLHPSQPDDGTTLDGIEVRHWRAAYAAWMKASNPEAQPHPSREEKS